MTNYYNPDYRILSGSETQGITVY